MSDWPSLPLEAWSDTYATLHLWLQIVGKVRLVQSPWVNHSWHVTLYPTATGLTTSRYNASSGPAPSRVRAREIPDRLAGSSSTLASPSQRAPSSKQRSASRVETSA